MQKCNKCGSEFYATDLKSVRRCKHTFCCKCLVEYLKVIVTPNVKCIIDYCKQTIQDNLIRECLSNDQILAYERLSIMNVSEKAVKCITENCTFLAICDETVSAFECDICQSPNCLRCKQRHYPNDCGKDISECLSDDQIIEYEQLSLLHASDNIYKCLTDSCPHLSVCEDASSFHCPYCYSPNCLKCNVRHFPDHGCGADNNDETVINDNARDALKERQRSKYLKLCKQYLLLPNPMAFTCPICDEYILPRKGVILRNCLHNFCKECLHGLFDCISLIRQMTCPHDECSIPMDSSEILELVGEDKLVNKIKREAYRFFQCVNGSCPGIWEATENTGLYECPECNKMNCVPCQDIHEGETCEEFRKTMRHKNARVGANILSKIKHIECSVCKKILIQSGGYSAVNCDRCGNSTCRFTGKIRGRHNPERCHCDDSLECPKTVNYCGCTAKKPCHNDCIDGCIPDYYYR